MSATNPRKIQIQINSYKLGQLECFRLAFIIIIIIIIITIIIMYYISTG